MEAQGDTLLSGYNVWYWTVLGWWGFKSTQHLQRVLRALQEEIPTALPPSLVLPFACPYLFFFHCPSFFYIFFPLLKHSGIYLVLSSIVCRVYEGVLWRGRLQAPAGKDLESLMGHSLVHYGDRAWGHLQGQWVGGVGALPPGKSVLIPSPGTWALSSCLKVSSLV